MTTKVDIGHLHLSHYAEATTDTAFKQMLSPSLDNDKSVLISFLNSFIPAFRSDPVKDISELSMALPALRGRGEKQTFMDLHVVSNSGAHYIIEMQARRHVMFDERALFYASGTYSRQLSEKMLSEKNWYYNLKPVIALQILDYESNIIRGSRNLPVNVVDTLFDRVAAAPMESEQFIKHFLLTDKFSKQVIDYLQLVQVELPRADRIKKLFPPQEDFTEQEWWLSIFCHVKDFTHEVVEDFHARNAIPDVIYKALMRLDFQQWNPGMVKEYSSDIVDRENFAIMSAEERNEGRKEMILSMLDNKIPVELVATVAKMSVEDVTTIEEESRKSEMLRSSGDRK